MRLQQIKPKIPISVLVLLHDGAGNALLLQRTDGDNLWQSVTGSIEEGEPLAQTAVREVLEETGICTQPQDLCDWHTFTDYEIYPRWLHRYAVGITRNREHVFSLQIPMDIPVILNPREHISCLWLPYAAAADKVFSPSNAQMLRRLKNLDG